MNKIDSFHATGAILLVLSFFSAPALAFSTMVSAQAQSCGGTQNMSDGAVGQDSATAAAASAGDCGDGISSSAVADASALIALGRIAVSGEGTGPQEVNGAFAQASFGERLTVEDVPAGIDTIELRIVIAFTGVPPEPAFYNSASMTGTVNPQGLPGEVRLAGCSGDLCFGGDPEVRTETLDQTIALDRNGLGTFGNIDVFMDARFAIASTSSSITGTVSVELLDVSGGRIVSESGVFGTGSPDADGDGVADDSDNCTLAANPEQIDADGDDYGNACDADLDNSCSVNFADLVIMQAVFFGADATADLNSDGTVNFGDLGIMKAQFFGPPGPSGLTDLCDP